MGKFSNLLKSIKYVIFNSMLDIHKQEVHSNILMVIFLLMKHLFGLILIVTMFITSSSLLPNLFMHVYNVILIKTQSQSIIYQFTFGLLSVQIISTILFSKILQSKISNTFSSRYLFAYMQVLQVFKYAILIALGSGIRFAIQFDKIQILIVNSFNLMILLLSIIIFNKFNFTVNYKNKNRLAHFQSTNNEITIIFISSLALYFGYIGLNSMSYFQTIIVGAIILTLKSFQIKYGLFRYFYIDPKAFLIYGFLSIIQANLIAMSIIEQLYSVSIISQNFIIVLIVTSFFSCWAWNRYFQNTQQEIYFYAADDLKSQSQVNLYLKAMCILALESQFVDQHSLILSSLRKQHEISCSCSRCYCRKSTNLNSFIEDYIIHQLNSIRKIFSQNAHVLLSELSFRYKTFKKYPNVLTRLAYLKIHVNFSFAQQFAAYCIEDSLKLWITQQNTKGNVIEAETPLQLEDVNQKLQKIIMSDIELKNKKWKYLARGLCRIQEIQSDTMKELQNMKTIQEIYESYIHKFKRSVSFNVLLIFYTRKIAFIAQNFQDLNKNIFQSLRKIKDQQISNEKQFKKYIFNKRSCVIESFIDQNNMGNITQVSKNIHNLFGYHKNKMIGSNINQLMPNFMAQEHVEILDDWVKNGTWRTIGKLKQIFCCHKDQFCFSALIYLKMYVRNEGLFFVTTIFKKNESDFLILNKKSEIQGIGRKWCKILGQNSKKMPIQILMNDFPSIKDKGTSQFQSIKLTIISLNSNNSFTQQYQQKRHNVHNQKERLQLLKTSKEKLIQYEQLQKWQIVFSFKKYRMRNIDFMVFQLTSANLIIETHISNMLSQHFDYSANRLRNNTTLVGSGKLCDQTVSLSDSGDSFQSNQTNHQENLENAFQDKGNSSLASIGQRQNFTLSKLLKTFYELLINPQKINDKRIKLFNISSIVFTLILIGLTIGSFLIYNLGLMQIQQYIRCNSQINMNMQMTTLMYNRFINLNQYKNDPVQFNNIIYSSFNDLNQFYSRIASNFQNIITSISDLNNTHLYEYLTAPVMWQYNSNNKTEIEVLQFLEYYSYFISQILISLQENSQSNLPPQGDLFFFIDRIKQNFPTLKKLNFEFSQQFVGLTQETSKRLNLTLYMSISLFFLVALMFSLTTNYYQYFRYNQKSKNLDIYKSLSGSCLQKIKDYYSLFFKELIQNSNSNYNTAASNQHSIIQKNYDYLNNNQIQVVEANNFSGYTNSSKHRLNFVGKSTYYQWIYGVILLILLNSLNVFMSVQIKGFINPLTDLMDQIDRIMDAENKILESYLDLKGNILLQVMPQMNNGAFNMSNVNTFDSSLYTQLQSLMDQNQVTFNQMITFRSSFLYQYDPNFYVDFNSILTQNVCQAIKGQIIQSEYLKCISLVNTNPILNDGVITYMNYFQRKLRTAIIDISNNYNQIMQQQQGHNYFINNNFAPIDFSMSFNIKIFGCLIDRILQSYNMGIQQIKYINLIVVILLSIPQILRIIFWLQTVRRQKKNLSFLYAYLLLIPPKIVRQVKNLVKDFQKNMQFQQNNT